MGKFAMIPRIKGQRIERDGNSAAIVEFKTGVEAFFKQGSP